MLIIKINKISFKKLLNSNAFKKKTELALLFCLIFPSELWWDITLQLSVFLHAYTVQATLSLSFLFLNDI